MKAAIVFGRGDMSLLLLIIIFSHGDFFFSSSSNFSCLFSPSSQVMSLDEHLA